MPALEIIGAALLVLGSVLVFRVLIETDRLLEEAAPSLEAPELEEAEPLRQAA